MSTEEFIKPSPEEIAARNSDVPLAWAEALWHITEAADKVGWNIIIKDGGSVEESITLVAIVDPSYSVEQLDVRKVDL